METRKSNELQIGKAGEYLACVDIITKGLIGYLSEQGLPYDVVIDNGKKLLKCQVKTTLEPRLIPQRNKNSYAYIFNIKRHGKNNKVFYHKNEVDLFILVCLDTRKVGYILNEDMPATINIRDDRLKGKYHDEKGIQDYKKVINLIKKGKRQCDIAKELNLHIAVVNRMCKKKYKPYKTKARYFSDFYKEKEWFLKI